MAIAPDKTPSDLREKPSDNDAVFTPIAPIEKPAFVPEPENTENPFVTLNPALTSVDLPPAKKARTLPPDLAKPLLRNEPLTASRPKDPAKPKPKSVNFLNETISINIAPEFMPPSPPPSAKTAMDFSLDYKNPEAEKLLSKSANNKTGEQSCHKCRTRMRNKSLLTSARGPVCPRCYNPYFHRLISRIYPDPDDGSVIERSLVAGFHFIAAWIVPLLPAIIWYALFVRTGFGGFFEDIVAIFSAPTIEGLAFGVLLLAGLFLIPACIASVSMGSSVIASLGQINPKYLFPLVKMAMPGYFLTFCVLAGTVMMNLAGIAWCAEAAGMGWAKNVMAIGMAVGLGAGEVAGVRWVVVKILFSLF